jgi:sugar/nucleoside kinase (ribokinase family)
MSLVIVGSLAFDTIETPSNRKEKIIGGSCAYAALAASFFTTPNIVAVVGEDFPQEVVDFFRSRGIDTAGLEIKKGKTFHWEGRYEDDPNQRSTIRTDLNVFQDFKPKLSEEYRNADIVFLGNIDPDLQDDVLSQVKKPKILAMDTINLWINNKKDPLLKVIKSVDIFFANDQEIKLLADEKNLIKAGKKILGTGPSLVAIKKGEHGALVIAKDFIFGVLAHPCEDVVDPTGAGDSFAGAFLGYLDKVKSYQEKDLRMAAVMGSAMASFIIEDFGIERFKNLTAEEIEFRFNAFKQLVSF